MMLKTTALERTRIPRFDLFSPWGHVLMII